MGQKKAYEVESWLSRPDAGVAIVLLYGPDRGLVSERGRLFAAGTGLSMDDPFSVIRFDGSELDSDPGRLMDEAFTVPMFGGKRLIWIRNASGSKEMADRIRELAAAFPPDLTVLIEAGDLKKGAALRQAVETTAACMALPCYADEARDLDRLIDAVFGPAGLSISPDVRSALRQCLGGDRLASRGELEKLAIYCAGKDAVQLDDVAALIPDVSATSADDVVAALLAGRLDPIDGAFRRATDAGSPIYPILAAAIRQLQVIEQLRGKVDADLISPVNAVSSARPPVFFKRRAAIENAVAALDAQVLRRILTRLQAGLLQTRQLPALEEALARSALLAAGTEIARKMARQ